MPLPFYVGNDDYYRLGQLKFYGKYYGLKRGYMLLHFRNSDGTAFVRYFGQETYVEEPLSVPYDDVNLDKDFIIYPNPAVGEITIKTNLLMPAKISICNLLGEKVIETDMKAQEMQLNLSGQVQNGIYFIILENKLSRYVKKLIVNN